MARKPMVTRTITTTKVNVLCMDIETAEPCNKEVILPRTYKDDNKVLRAVSSVLTDNIKPVHIVDKVEVDTMYGMSEQDFITHATELDPQTRKALQSEETTDED